jgi:predicted restriction endonuclease
VNVDEAIAALHWLRNHRAAHAMAQGNQLCLCPNCHVLFAKGAFLIAHPRESALNRI